VGNTQEKGGKASTKQKLRLGWEEKQKKDREVRNNLIRK
jgi:hypothetical protein